MADLHRRHRTLHPVRGVIGRCSRRLLKEALSVAFPPQWARHALIGQPRKLASAPGLAVYDNRPPPIIFAYGWHLPLARCSPSSDGYGPFPPPPSRQEEKRRVEICEKLKRRCRPRQRVGFAGFAMVMLESQCCERGVSESATRTKPRVSRYAQAGWCAGKW